MPAESAMPVLFRVIRLLVSLTLALGVSVPVQVIPPSLLLRPVTVPLAVSYTHLTLPTIYSV